jgi:hypothetical protein
MSKEELTKKIRDLYYEEAPCTRETGSVGGHMHIVLDDENVEDEHVKFCIGEAEEDDCKTCIEIGLALLRLTEDERFEMAYNADL